MHVKIPNVSLEGKKKYCLSKLRSILHGPTVPDPSLPNNLDDVHVCSGTETHSNNESYSCVGDDSNKHQLFDHNELKDLVRDLCLAKESVELLGSRFKSKNLLAHGTSFS